MSQPPSTDQGAQRIECLAILGLNPPVTVEDVKQAYLDKVKVAHPDHGGNAQQFIRLHEAFQQATEYAQFKAGRMLWLSRWVEQYADQQLVVQEIQALGGRVEIESVNWLAQSIGPDFATVLDRIILLHLSGPRVDDRVLHELATQRRALAGVRRLELIGTKVTSAGLSALHDCQSLRYLDLMGTRVSSQAVRALLSKLPSLETIVLDNTGIGWWFKMRFRWSRPGLSFSVSKDAGAPEGLV